MTESTEARVFEDCMGCLIASSERDLAAQISFIPGLSPSEVHAILEGARDALLTTLNRKLTRLLVLELNAARVEQRLEGDTPEARWADFLACAATPAFWDSLDRDYPTLRARVDRLIGDQIDAVLAFARHWAQDRAALAPLLGQPAGDLTALRLAKGDRHAGGRTVAMVETTSGPIVYKPRSLAVDIALSTFLERLGGEGTPLSLQVATVLDRGDHGWARFVPHRHAADDEQLASFYCGIGEALAVMRALGGTDFHAENLIAHGGAPVLIDCETLFTPNVAAFPSPYGRAHDHAAALVAESVLAIGLLPDRAQGLGWRGIDMSGVGGLPDQQQETLVPGLVDAGTDQARIELVPARAPRAGNHPSETPRLMDFWPQVLQGYDDVTERLRRLDSAARLEPLLHGFAACRVRVVVRPTETYAELARMLWHPISLADEPAARARAEEVLMGMARNFSSAPSDPAVIAAEIDDLLIDDIPMFTTTPGTGQLTGPAGVHWLPPRDLIADNLADWRRADAEAERNFIRSALVSAYVNDGFLAGDVSFRPKAIRHHALDARRRQQAARIMRSLIDAAQKGDDGTVTWVAPTLMPTGWTVTPLGPDLYAGLSGVLLLSGAYVVETRAGRADRVEGVEDLLHRLRHTLRLWEGEQRRERVEGAPVRPPSMGGYVGLGSQIWSRVALHQIGLDDDRAIADALAIAEGMAWAEQGDDRDDLLYGRAGAIPPLLLLAEISGDPEPLAAARAIGHSLCDAATRQADGRCVWTHAHFPEGVGGFAHGVSGVGWALARLAAATGEPRFAEYAAGAFAFEDSLWDAEERNWRDLRRLEGVTSSLAWCHGAVGIALARIDLDPELALPETAQVLDRAVQRTWEAGMGGNHSLCHGDFGAWELFGHAIRHGRAPKGMEHAALLAELVTALEDHGPICGVTRDAFNPGLFTGTGGILYQLLRAHPEARLPSALMLG